MSKENLDEEQYTDILARAAEESNIDPSFLADQAPTYGTIRITTPARSSSRSSTPAGFGMGGSDDPLSMLPTQAEMDSWILGFLTMTIKHPF